MFKRFLCFFLAIVLGINVCRIGFNPSFWSYSDEQKLKYIVNAEYVLDTVSDFSEDYNDIIIDIYYLRDNFIYAWNAGFLSGLTGFFTKTVPDIVRIFIDGLNIVLDCFNVVFALVGLPTFGNIPLWERGNPRVYPPGSGGGGGARGSLAPLIISGLACVKGAFIAPDTLNVAFT